MAEITEASNLVGVENSRPYHLLFGAAVILLILPLWCVRVLPWTDFGDHLARAYILRHYSEIPVFNRYYVIQHRLLPNLAMDLILPPLLRWVNPYLAAKLLASFMVIVFAMGCHLFGWAVHGRPTWLAIPAAFLFYNSLLLNGFVNYTCGVALFLCSAAAWLIFDRNHSVVFLLGTTFAAFATYVSHLAGFFFLCVFIGVMTLWSISRNRRISIWNLLGLLVLAPPLWFYFELGSAKGDTSSVIWRSFISKLSHSGVLVAGYSIWMDAITLGGLVIIAAVVFTKAKVTVNRPVLLIGGLFVLAFCIFPEGFHTGTEADTRFILPAGLMLMLALTVVMARPSGRIVFMLLMAVFAFRIVSMGFYWRMNDAFLNDQLTLLRLVKDQSRIYPMIFLPSIHTQTKLHDPLHHLAGYAAIDRHSISGSIFAVPGQQPIQHRIPFPFREMTPSLTAARFPWNEVLMNYDYVWAYDAPPEFRKVLDRETDLVAKSGLGRLYSVHFKAE